MNFKRFMMNAGWMVLGIAIAYLLLYCIMALGSTRIVANNNDRLELTYADLISVLLTAVSLILAALGLVIAIVAFIGWSSINERVASNSRTFFLEAIKDGGELHKLMTREVQNAMYRGIDPVSLSDANTNAREGPDGSND